MNKINRIVLAACGLICLAGCGGKNQQTAAKPESKKANPPKAAPVKTKTKLAKSPQARPKKKQKKQNSKQRKNEQSKKPTGKKETGKKKMTQSTPNSTDVLKEASKVGLATVGGGCFWCVEAVFENLEGVISVESGYSGGYVENPTYEQVCAKKTGHAEVCRIKFDPKKVEFKDLLEVFWKTHDPTTPNQQGADKGPQYRSVIFFHNEAQQTVADKYKTELNKAGAFNSAIVTEISKLINYYPAEPLHQDYYRLNPGASYCQFVIGPKMAKFRKVFESKLKKKD